MRCSLSSSVIAYRGSGADRPAALPLPPARAPMLHRFRLHKTWRYVGVWSPTVSVCAARVQVGPVPQEFWGVWHRAAGRLTEHTRLWAGRVDLTPGRIRVRDRGNRLDLPSTRTPTPRSRW